MMCIGVISSQLLLDTADFIYVAIDVDQKVTLINRKGCEILGYSEDEIIGKNWFDNFLPKEVAGDFKSNFVRRITENKETKLAKSYTLLTKEGEERLISWHSTFFNDEEGNLVGALCSGEDITDYTRTKQMLEANERKFSKCFNHSNDGYALRKLDGTILDANLKFLELFGYKKDEVISKNIKEIELLEDSKELSRLIKEIGKEGFLQVETTARKKDGTTFPIELNGITFDLEGEKVVFNIIRDLTESRKRETVLRESEERFRGLFETAAIGMAIVDLEGKPVASNEALQKMLGYTNEELCSMTFTEFTHPDDATVDMDLYMELIAGKRKYYQIEKRYITKNKKLIWGNLTATLIRDENGEPLYGIGMVEEITQLKETIIALAESESKYRTLLESLPQKIFHKDADLKYVSCNENLANDLNIKPSEIKGKTDFDFFTSELAEKYRAEDKRIMKERKVETIEEKTVKNGKEYTSETTKIPLYDEKGESVGVIGIYYDISERVKTERELQESEEKYRSFVQNFQGIAFRRTLDFKPIFFHGAVEEITGYTEEEFVSTSLTWDKLIHPEDIVKIKELLEKLSNVPDLFNEGEYRIIHKNGEIKWINEIVRNICDEKGKPIYVQGCIHDHTERKVIEEKIKENEEKFRTLFTEMKQAYSLYEAIYDKRGDIEDAILIEANPEYEKIVNKKREEIIGKKISEIYPNLKKQEVNPIAILGRTAITGETVISEYYNKDVGKWLLAKSFSPMKDHAAILFEDITEKRKMEKELEKERKATQQYLDIVNIILTVIDANENVILVNKKGCELLGYEHEEIIGKNWFENYLPKRVREETKEIYQDLLAGKLTHSESHENLILTKDGEERLIAWDNTYIRDEEGTIVSTLSSGRDITEMNKAQKELKENEEKFRSIFNHSNDGYILRSVEGVVLEANPRFLEIFGYESTEVISTNIRLINTYETEEDHISRKQEIDEKGYAQFETFATRKDGSIFPMEVNAIKLLLSNEEVVFVIVRDITERKKAETKIKSSEALYKALFDNTGTAMMLAEEDFTITLVNELFLEKSGLSQEELLGKKWTDFIQKAEKENIIKAIKRMVTDFIPPIIFETSEFWILGENKTLLVSIGINPETRQHIASLIDITEKKKLEKELSTSEEKYRELFNNVPIALSQTKPSGEIVECNSAFINIFGYKNAEELKKVNVEELYFDRSERKAVLAAKDKAGYSEFLLQKMKKKDETPIWVEMNSKISYDDNQNVSHYDTYLKDVTDKKEIEERLKQSEEKFRSIFNHSVDGYMLRDEYGIILEHNPMLLEIFGYDEEDLDGMDITKFEMKENTEDFMKIRDMLASKGHAFLETRFMKKDKTWISTAVSAIKFDLAGRDVVFSILRDISKRKETEELLKTSEERLRTLFENIPIAISINSSEGEKIDINPAYCKTFGYANKEECLSKPSTERWFNPRDRERLYDSLRQRNFVNNFEAKRFKNDGSEFWGSVSAVAHLDAKGEKVYFMSIRDITTEKQREEDLKKQTLRYYLKESQLYLSEEERPYISKEAFIDLLKVGYNGLVLSRLPETEWKKDTKYEFDFLRLAEKGHLKTISSDLSKIEQLIEELPNKHVIVIDRLDYLISKNGFETTLFFIFRLMDIAYLSNHIIIVSLDPATLNEKERKSMRKEMRIIESVAEASLPEELIEILDFVHRRNNAGYKPSYTDIVETFKISRPTARKRIKDLINDEFIFELTKGRSKVLGITTKGKAIFD